MKAVTLQDLISSGRQLEVGCQTCKLHIFIDAAAIVLPADTPVPAICGQLKCPQCKSVNRVPGHPIWARPDARPPKMGAM